MTPPRRRCFVLATSKLSFLLLTPRLLDTLEGYWNTDGALADETLAIIINVTEAGPVEQSFTVFSVDATGSVIFGASGASFTVNGIGQYVLPVDIATFKRVDPRLAGFRIAAATQLDTPMNYHAWISQIKS